MMTESDLNIRTVVDTDGDAPNFLEGKLKMFTKPNWEKGLYYCDHCEKDVDVEIPQPSIRAIYTPVKVEVVVRVYCAECKMPLDMGIGLIVLRD